LAWLWMQHEERALIRRNAIRKTTNTKQQVESSGNSSKASLGESRNNEAITSEYGERNFGWFVIEQYLLSLGVS